MCVIKNCTNKMEQIQPLKKRIVEQPSFYTPQRTFIKSSTSQEQRQSQLGQYYQYVPIIETKSQAHQQNEQTLQQQQHQTGQQHRLQQQQEPERNQERQSTNYVPQMVQYEYYEAPMTLNAWTQTNPDDFPNILPSIYSRNEAALLAKIQQLEQSLKAQTDVLNGINKRKTKSPSPEQIVSNSSTITPSTINHDGTTYRILTQSNEANSENQIEIELSDDTQTNSRNISPPKVYTVRTIPETLSENLYTQKVINPIISNNSESCMVSIGPNDTKIPATEFEKMSWTSASIATRKLLTIIFNRETLATHSMTGKASPAFKDLDKPVKGKLDANAIQDIIYIVSKKCRVSAKEVRSAITTKCADENKMFKLKEMKRLGLQEPKRSALSEINKLQKDEFDKENT